MKSSASDRIQKAAAASKAPSQVVSRPIPALGLFIAAAHQSAVNPTNVNPPTIPLTPSLPPRDNKYTMDTKFPVATRSTEPLKSPRTSRATLLRTPEKSSRVNLITPPEYSGKLEKKHNVELTHTTINPWSSEAYSIFQGNYILDILG